MNLHPSSSSTLYDTEGQQQARTDIGVVALPLNLPVVISAEVEIASP
jgi:hypothetical protein